MKFIFKADIKFDAKDIDDAFSKIRDHFHGLLIDSSNSSMFLDYDPGGEIVLEEYK